MARKPEVGDELVLHVPVVRVNENEPWSTVTFALGARQWVTIPLEANEIVDVRGRGELARDQPPSEVKQHDNRPANPGNGEFDGEWSVRPTSDGASTEIVIRSNSGTTEFALPPADLARFASMVLSETGRVADRLPEAPPLHEMDAVVLQPRHASFEPHPTDATATIAAFAIGRLRLALSLNTGALLRSMKTLLERRRLSQVAASSAERTPSQIEDGH
jgi:hypothetical protein